MTGVKMHRKTGKQEAGYRARPHGARCCARCALFRPPHACARVAGDISPRGWSRYFAWKDVRTHQLARAEQATLYDL